MDIELFRERIWDWYRDNARDLPWRPSSHKASKDKPIDPYRVVVSELMLQQTQVARVLERYPRWLRRFPSFEVLGGASTHEVLEEWQGMGYNRRALFAKRIAEAVVRDYAGELPQSIDELAKLPGIGPNTAGSIAAFAFNAPVVFIETNIRRVFIHEFFPESEHADRPIDDKQLMPLIEAALDRENPREWYYALMDYGSYLAKTVPNPNRRSKHHAVQSKFEGSKRQLRGEVLRRLLAGPSTLAALEITDRRLDSVMAELTKEGFLVQSKGTYRLAK